MESAEQNRSKRRGALSPGVHGEGAPNCAADTWVRPLLLPLSAPAGMCPCSQALSSTFHMPHSTPTVAVSSSSLRFSGEALSFGFVPLGRN